jgi:hypothetical protein
MVAGGAGSQVALHPRLADCEKKILGQTPWYNFVVYAMFIETSTQIFKRKKYDLV